MLKFLKIISPKYKIWVTIFLFLSLLNIVLDTFSIILILPLIQILFDTGDVSGKLLDVFNIINNFLLGNFFDNEKDVKTFFLFFFVVTFIFKNIYQIFFNYYQNILFGSIEADVSIKIIQKNLSDSTIISNKKSLAETLRDSNNYASIFAHNFLVPLINIVIDISVFLLIFLFIGYNYLQETLIIGLFFGVLSLVYYFIIRKKIKIIALSSENAQKLKIKSVLDSFDLFKEVKIFNLYDLFLRSFSKQAYRIIKMQNYLAMARYIAKPIIEISFIMGITYLLFILLSMDKDLTEFLPKLSLFAFAAMRILPSINKTNMMIHRISMSEPILISLYKQLNKFKFNHDNKNNKNLSPQYDVKIKNLSFRYPDQDDLVFDKINLTIKKNKSYFIFGNSGVGKSTFVELILGLLKPSTGSILLGNSDIKKNILNWQKKLSYVSQRPNLINDTLINNITLFSEDKNKDMQKLDEIVKLLNLENLLKNNIIIGDKGKGLSGGQIQRVAIARSLFKDSKILVIDEGTSALDGKSEIKIIKSILKYKKNIAILFISHKKHLKKYFDYTLEIQNKKIKEKKIHNA